MRKLITILFATCCLMGCNRTKQPQEMVCGVPVKGTAWELTAAVADHGDGSFIPECVSLQLKNKTYVDGWIWIDADLQLPAELIIETDSTGQAIYAFVYCQELDTEE